MSKIQFPVDNLHNFLEVKNQTENSADLYFYGDSLMELKVKN